jgi:adenosylcobinamide-GDP ribazoletransferase
VPALRDSLNHFARRFSLALHHSTRVRLGGALAAPADADADTVRASAGHLPGTGWVIGLAAAVSFALVALALRGSPWSPAVAAVACLMATVTLTGARGESALFRAMETLQPARTPAGSGLGVIALVLLLLGKVSVLATLASASEAGLMTVLFAAPVVSRFAALLAAQWLAGESGHTLRVAALWCLVPLVLMLVAVGPVFLLLALLAAGFACWATLRLLKARPGMPAEDAAGTVQQVCELAFYLGAAIGV